MSWEHNEKLRESLWEAEGFNEKCSCVGEAGHLWRNCLSWWKWNKTTFTNVNIVFNVSDKYYQFNYVFAWII